MLYSFPQLYAYHVFAIPLPKTESGVYCRECGGPMEEPKKADYGQNWLDEGLIAYSESLYTCPACAVAKAGSQARILLAPPYAYAIVVTPSRINPAPELLRQCHGTVGKGMKDTLYMTALKVEDVLREYKTYDPPFGIVIGTGGDAKKHFLRSVPLNYDTGDVIAVYAVPPYSAVYLRPSLILAVAEEAANWEVAVQQTSPAKEKKRRSAPALFYEYVRKLQETHGLTPAEATVMRMIVQQYAPSKQSQ